MIEKEWAEVAGINEATPYKWLKKGKQAKRGKYKDFYNDFQMAKNRNKLFHLKKIPEAEQWTASAGILKDYIPKSLAGKDRMDLRHEGYVEVNKSVR